MISESKNLLWDSNVFIRFLTKMPIEYVLDIGEYIADAKRGDRKIYYSTVVLGEIKPSHLKVSGYGSWNDFIEDFKGAFIAADQSPNIMIDVGIIRDLRACNPNKPTEKQRTLSTQDATVLMTGVHLIQVNGLSDLVLHTFDDGKGENWAGRCVPLLSFQDYYSEHVQVPQIAAICAMPRRPPSHPQSSIPLLGERQNGIQTTIVKPSGSGRTTH